MNERITNLGFDAKSNPDGTLTLKRYDDKSKFWVTITSIQSQSSNENEERVLNILKKNYIERNSDQ